jgi:hypothetical protein
METIWLHFTAEYSKAEKFWLCVELADEIKEEFFVRW